MYKVIISDKAGKFYQKCDQKLAGRINIAIDCISENPFQGNHIKSLKGQLKGLYRYKIGNYRIIYSIEKEVKIVSIVWIGSRQKAY